MKIHNQAMKNAEGTATIASPAMIIGDSRVIVNGSTLAAPMMKYGAIRHETNGKHQTDTQSVATGSGTPQTNGIQRGCQFIRSPVRPGWANTPKKKRAASPIATRQKATSKNGIHHWQGLNHRFGRMAADASIQNEEEDDEDMAEEDSNNSSVNEALATNRHSNQTQASKAHLRMVVDKLRSGPPRQENATTTPRQRTTLRQSQGRQSGVGNEARIYRKMSSDADEFEDEHEDRLQNQSGAEEEEEVRSAMAGSSSCNSSGHHEEIQSNRSSSSDDYSQSDLSLCDDGGSEMEEGDDDHQILGHLGENDSQMLGLGKHGDDCYEEDEEGSYSLLQHAKNHDHRPKNGSRCASAHRSGNLGKKRSHETIRESTAWDFNDFIELIEQDTSQIQKPIPESDQLSRKISFYPTNGSQAPQGTSEKLERVQKQAISQDNSEPDFISINKKTAQSNEQKYNISSSGITAKKEVVISIGSLEEDPMPGQPAGLPISSDQQKLSSSAPNQTYSSPKLRPTTFIPSSCIGQPLLGKRTHQQKKEKFDGQANSMNSAKSCGDHEKVNPLVDESIDSGSLLDRILHKRQRLNSEASSKKLEFSFLPTQKVKSGNSTTGNNDSSFSPTTNGLIKLTRDLKASEKQNARKNIFNVGDEIKEEICDPRAPMVAEIEIKVPDLKRPSFTPTQNVPPPKKPEPSSRMPQPAESQDQKRRPTIFTTSKSSISPTIRDSFQPSKTKKANDHLNSPSFPNEVQSKPAGLRDRVLQMAQFFGGECLSAKKLSIVKGAEAYKFKCINGHIFYRFVTELENNMRPLQQLRKLSKTTAASSSSSHSDDDMSLSSQLLEANSCWCPKCESFYRGAATIAKNCGFKLCGEIYSKNLSLKCNKAKHVTELSYQKRLQGNLKCAACRKDERDAVKARLREEERLQDQYYSQMQEKMFAQARLDMEREMADAGLSGYEQPFFMDEAQRRQLMEQRINQTADALARTFMQEQGQNGDSSAPTVSKDQAALVYKFLNTPQEMIVAGMSQMQPAQLTQFYRKLAKQLHPDKNQHPQAKEAFQVVQSAMDSAQAAARRGSF